MADIVILDMPLLNTTRDKDLVGTLITDIVLQLLSFVAESERQNIKRRQTEGIAIAKRKGVHMGRPQMTYPENWDPEYRKWKSGEITAIQCMKLMGLKKDSFYRLVKRFENTHDPQ